MRTKDDIKTQKKRNEEKYEHRSWRKIEEEERESRTFEFLCKIYLNLYTYIVQFYFS